MAGASEPHDCWGETQPNPNVACAPRTLEFAFRAPSLRGMIRHSNATFVIFAQANGRPSCFLRCQPDDGSPHRARKFLRHKSRFTQC
jgi:hypothetical protein